MSRKYTFLLLLCIVIVIIIEIWQLNDKPDVKQNSSVIQLAKKDVLPTETFIQTHLLMNDGIIYTDFKQNEGGSLILSESMGLWMKYLVEKGDADQFDDSFQSLKKHFLLHNNLVAWRIKGGETAKTNALIDDLRLIESLFMMGEQTENEQYIETAHKMAEAVMTFNKNDHLFVDFYDNNHEYANEQITLSYLNYNAFKYMEKYKVMSNKDMNQLKTFMDDIKINNGFFPKYYDFKNNQFHYEETINLIDQLYVAIYLEQANITTNDFYSWLKETFYEQNNLYGRYNFNTKAHDVDYESAAVYALAVFYAVKREDNQFAKDLYNQMITLRIQDDMSSFYGGYMNESLNETHSFDNLLPLLAERILMNEQIIK